LGMCFIRRGVLKRRFKFRDLLRDVSMFMDMLTRVRVSICLLPCRVVGCRLRLGPDHLRLLRPLRHWATRLRRLPCPLHYHPRCHLPLPPLPPPPLHPGRHPSSRSIRRIRMINLKYREMCCRLVLRLLGVISICLGVNIHIHNSSRGSGRSINISTGRMYLRVGVGVGGV